MPMVTVYTADPALKFRCAESKSFVLVPNRINSFPTNIPLRRVKLRVRGGRWGAGWTFTEVHPYSRLEYYGLRQGYVWDVWKGVNESTHYMTEFALGICYFKNSA